MATPAIRRDSAFSGGYPEIWNRSFLFLSLDFFENRDLSAEKA